MTEARKKHRIKKLLLSEISLVDRPAEPNSMIHIFKRGEPGQQENRMPDNLEQMVKQMETATATIQTLTKAKEDAEGAVAKANARVAELEAEVGKLKATVPPADEDVTKSITDPKLKAAFEELRKNADAATKALAKLADERAEASFVDEVRKSFTALPIKPEDFGPVLKRVMTSISDDDGKELRRVLKAADALAKAGARTVGASGTPPSDSAEAEIEAKAQEMAKSSAGKIGYAAAYDRVLKDHPELYKRYLEESGQRVQ